jgi:hypothetical protein
MVEIPSRSPAFEACEACDSRETRPTMMPKAQRLILASAAVFALVWAIARACIQSITIDEAATYIHLVRTGLLFWPASNNHILNTVLMWLFTQMFGTSELTVRLPALIGATLYITASYRVCGLLSRSLILQLVLFVCLVYNPFIFDYLVAARGYALALGFLMWAIAVPTTWFLSIPNERSRSLLMACGISSMCIGLSIAANFAFAFVDLVTMALIFSFAFTTRKMNLGSLLICCWLPLAIVTLGISGSAIVHMPRQDLYWGATSLVKTFGGIMLRSFYRMPFDFANRPSFILLIWLLFGVTSLARFLFVLFRRDRNSPLFRFALVMASIIAATATIHWAGFRLFDLLLPKGRTGIYFFPLSILAVGSLAAIPPSSYFDRYLRGSILGVLLAMTICFLLCLRLTYFEEWRWDADVKKVYSVLDCMARNNGVSNISACWCYVYSLNFYRLQSKHSSLSEVLDDKTHSTDTGAWVVNTFFEQDSGVLKDRGLKIVYRGRPLPGGVGNTVIAVKPELSRGLLPGPCFRD